MSTFIFIVSVHLCIFAFYQIEASLAIWDDCLGLLGGGSPLTDPRILVTPMASVSQKKVKAIAEEKTSGGYILELFNVI